MFEDKLAGPGGIPAGKMAFGQRQDRREISRSTQRLTCAELLSLALQASASLNNSEVKLTFEGGRWSIPSSCLSPR